VIATLGIHYSHGEWAASCITTAYRAGWCNRPTAGRTSSSSSLLLQDGPLPVCNYSVHQVQEVTMTQWLITATLVSTKFMAAVLSRVRAHNLKQKKMYKNQNWRERSHGRSNWCANSQLKKSKVKVPKRPKPLKTMHMLHACLQAAGRLIYRVSAMKIKLPTKKTPW